MTRPHLYLLALILVFAASVRAYGLASVGLWTDELCTLSCSQGWGLQFDRPPLNQVIGPRPTMTRLADARPVSAVITGMARDEAHPPLYFLLLRGWEDLFGDGDAAVRTLNLVLSVVAIGLLYAAAVPDVGPTAAVWACLLMAVATPQVQFALEARNYVPVETFGLAAVVAANRLRRRPAWPAAVAFAASLVAMMLTHYFAAGVATAVVATAVVRSTGSARRWVLASAVTAGVVYLAIWGPGLWAQRANFAGNYGWLSDVGPGHGRRLLVRLCRVPARLIAEEAGPVEIAAGAALLAGGVVAALFRPALRPWLAWAACGIGLVAVVDLLRGTSQLSLTRYTLFAAPGLYVAAAAALPGRRAWVLPVVGVVAGLLALPTAYAPAWKADLGTPATAVDRRIGPDDALVVAGPNETEAGVAFAAFRHYARRPPAVSVVLTRPAGPAVVARLRQCPHVWLVWMWADGRPVEGELPGYQPSDVFPFPYLGTIEEGTLIADAPVTRP